MEVPCDEDLDSVQGDSENEEDVEERAPRPLAEADVYPTSKQCRHLVQQAVSEINPTTVDEVTSHFAKKQSYAILTHPSFKFFCKEMIDARKIMYLDLPWSHILASLPDCKYSPKEYLSVDESISWFKKICVYNSIDPNHFIECVDLVIEKSLPKKNSLMLLGPPQAGKTLVGKSIAESCLFHANAQNFEGKSSFEFAPLQFCRVALINEPRITDSTVQVMKNVLEGNRVNIDVKYSSAQTLNRTPVIITTNEELCYYTTNRTVNAQAFKARAFIFNLKPYDELKHCSRALHPKMWSVLRDDCGL